MNDDAIRTRDGSYSSSVNASAASPLFVAQRHARLSTTHTSQLHFFKQNGNVDSTQHRPTQKLTPAQVVTLFTYAVRRARQPIKSQNEACNNSSMNVINSIILKNNYTRIFLQTKFCHATLAHGYNYTISQFFPTVTHYAASICSDSTEHCPHLQAVLSLVVTGKY